MRNIFGFVFLLVVGFSCSPKAEKVDGAQSESGDWKEMDDFHMVMAESYHPYRDSANLAPVKTFAREMVTLAETWSTSKLPARVDNEDVKSKIQELKEATVALADLVEIGSDEAIGTSLTHVHDTFHHLQEAWYKKEHHQ